ncbi:MAG: ABC transporter ATP-binding protein [Bacteroidia bacterium]|nr:ABC transporter ATP-binding protein [Bacteroidia bacterium]MBP7259891.1 ABC transporter ATP-binding protein [Bacteroidia bacterium]MBP9179960.1 ABC transporter ATP-binding protein [Bacteroidia bacterium]MBP9723470.1 ABC transporter ATP-binding protein [Bacteroidia bacterium]
MHPLRHLNKYFLKYKSYLLWGFLFVTLSNLFGVFPAQAVRVAFDMLADSILLYRTLNGFALQSSVYDVFVVLLMYFAFMVLLFNVIKGVFMYFMRQTLIVMSRHIEFDMKNEIFAHYQQLSPGFYRKQNTGDLMARISEDVSRVRMYAGPAIMYTMNLVTTFVLVISVMLQVNATLTLYVLLPLPFLSFSIYYVNNIINRKSDAIQSQLSSITSFVQESMSGIRVIKSFAVEEAMLHNFEKESELYKKKSLSLAKVDSMFFPLMMLLVGLSTLITVYVGGVQVLNGTITTGNIAEFILYVNMLTWPVASLGWVTSIIQRASASQQRINEFLGTLPEVVSVNNEPVHFEKEIRLERVSFRYLTDGPDVLKNISFVLPKGKTTAIIGATGSGKSTLAALLMRMYDVTEGKITVDGKDIKQINLDAFRQKAAFVPQEVFLFSDTIYNNIRFGISGQDTDDLRERVQQAARMASVEKNILDFPNAYETEVGERGVTLSGGQKQRISLARAIARNPELLVLDDCLSAIDTKTENEILSNFGRLFKGKTVFIISHRVSSVQHADNIMVLDEGKIAEQGTHEALMHEQGKYFQIYQKQQQEEVQGSEKK